MSNELVIDSNAEEQVIALLQGGKLLELHKELKGSSFNVGDILLGRVKKLIPGLNAAFVDVGYEKDAFLHYLDLGPQILSFNNYTKRAISGKLNTAFLANFKQEKDINKGGKITDVLKPNQNIMVQISKEPISTKGPRITGEITIAGRYVVLVPFSERVSISQKIKDEKDRERLKRLMMSIKPQNFGVIVRTVAQDIKVAELDADLKDLVSKWKTLKKNLWKAQPRKKVLGELDRSSALLRDMLNASFTDIHVNDPEMEAGLKAYLRNIAPDKEGIVKGYRNKLPIFEKFGIEKQIKALFGKHVSMESGAYLVVEHTEALHVIDVNSGNTAKSEVNQENTALKVNIEAAQEIARQLRLRDMGGIVVIDFIDMRKSDNRKVLFEKMKGFMKSDRAKHNILPPSKFGLIQITRQRVRPEMDIKTSEKCPSCQGTGEVTASVLLVDKIERDLKYILQEQNESSIVLMVHPYLEAFLKKGFPSIQMKWFKSHRKWIKIKGSNALAILEYSFQNSGEDKIVT